MSAIRRKETIIDENLVRYEYEQPIKIPSYLIAIVVGDLVSKWVSRLVIMLFW